MFPPLSAMAMTPPPSPRLVSTLASSPHTVSHHHQAACPHSTVTRLFGPVRCHVCASTPKIGFVYACTQDHDGELPELSRSMPCTAPLPRRLPSEEPETTQLSPWIQRAIEEDHYTPEQVRILQAQKRAVYDAIVKEEERVYGKFRSCLVTWSPNPPNTTTSDSATSLDRIDSHEGHCQNHATVFHDLDGTFESVLPPLPRLQPVCHLRICHRCRTTYSERALPSLGAILAAENTKPIPQADFDNRRVSDASLVKAMGGRRLRRVLKTITDLRSSSGSDVVFEDDAANVISADADLTSFSNTYGIPAPEKADGAQSTDGDLEEGEIVEGYSIDTSLDTQTNRSMIYHSRKYNSGFGPAANASQGYPIPARRLPDITEDSEGSEGGNSDGEELAVKDGIAVTEEGVSNKSADIIVQA